MKQNLETIERMIGGKRKHIKELRKIEMTPMALAWINQEKSELSALLYARKVIKNCSRMLSE